ncbi:hypothetical protein [Microbacterium indicum]|uniref:hypothetical protein n=1 Tax=Microbacterium indicum TaxID=358100 RepID=UPI000428F9EA|nr:hypothetical protein [Microbacterium indicum]
MWISERPVPDVEAELDQVASAMADADSRVYVVADGRWVSAIQDFPLTADKPSSVWTACSLRDSLADSPHPLVTIAVGEEGQRDSLWDRIGRDPNGLTRVSTKAALLTTDGGVHRATFATNEAGDSAVEFNADGAVVVVWTARLDLLPDELPLADAADQLPAMIAAWRSLARG